MIQILTYHSAYHVHLLRYGITEWTLVFMIHHLFRAYTTVNITVRLDLLAPVRASMLTITEL